MVNSDANSFGSLPFLSRISSVFRSQAKLLDELLKGTPSETIRPVAPLIHAIWENCKATELLEKANLLNETLLVQRVLVERVVNCCFLIAAGKEERERYVNHPTSGGVGLPAGSPEALIESAKQYETSQTHSAFSNSLRERVEIIAKQLGVKEDFFLMAIASVFPQSSEILSGSLYGHVFHLGIFKNSPAVPWKRESIPTHIQEEYSSLLLMDVLLLDELFKVLAKHQQITGIIECSNGNVELATQLMRSSKGAKEMHLTAADGAWDRLGNLEFTANQTVEKQLEQFESPFRDAYEAGVIVPVLRAKGQALLDVNVAALFLKRVLNDLRGVWLLLQVGYTSQAASIAASLYESALATICLTHSQKNIDAFLADPYGEIPWKPKQMAKMVIQGEGKAPQSKESENGWRALYGHYVWLCQVKHSARDSVIHDTVASSIGEKGYVVMAIPNVREQDIRVKVNIAIIALHRTLESVEAFAKVLGFPDKLPDDFGFSERVDRARKAAWEAFAPHLKSPMPISIGQSRFVQKYPPVK